MLHLRTVSKLRGFSTRTRPPGLRLARPSEPAQAPEVIDATFIQRARERVGQGLVSESRQGPLSIFCYSKEGFFDGKWDDVTRRCRGLIWNNETQTLLARPFPKFFEAGESEQFALHNLPQEPFTVTEKLDGSLGILYFHDGLAHVASKSRLQSGLTEWGTRWVREHIDTGAIDPSATYLLEMLYPHDLMPEGRGLVVDYGKREECVLLSCIRILDGRELSHDEVLERGRRARLPVVARHAFASVDDLYRNGKALAPNQEGYVVTFASGLKVKVKSEWYKLVQRAKNNLSPLFVWEALAEDGRVRRAVLDAMPGEVLEDFHDLQRQIEKAYADLHASVLRVWAGIDRTGDRKSIALQIQRQPEELQSMLFALMTGRTAHEGILKRIRPTGNELPPEE